jgi:hypothetical protein
MYSRSGRIETRITLEVMVRIASLEHPGLVDTGTTQNASPFGLRAIVRKRWIPNEPVLIESPPGEFLSRGWVVYCDPVAVGQFAVGLRLLAPKQGWMRKRGEAA